ncbi:MAG: SPOR domain-containing protein [Paludibacteraceae bacterium]|nr:SPOR domain-containing protein [Paludibacteraceae bacterium]
MRPAIFLLLLWVCALPLTAEDSIPEPSVRKPLPIEAAMQERVQLHQSADISRMMQDKIDGTQRELKTVQGYRVQIFSSNRQQTAKTEAFEKEKRIRESGIEAETYVLYNPPFWKVRIGDFRTQEEALLMKDEVIRLLPDLQGDTYVVRDMIQVME